MLSTKSLDFQSPHAKLYGRVSELGELRTWGCLAWVRIPTESRQRKEKLKPRVRLSLLLGYSDSTKGYKFLDLLTCQVITAQGGNACFHEDFTSNGTYVKQLLENMYLVCAHQLPDTVPVERIKPTMDTYVAAEAEPVPASLQFLPCEDSVGVADRTLDAVCSASKSSGRLNVESSANLEKVVAQRAAPAGPAEPNVPSAGKQKGEGRKCQVRQLCDTGKGDGWV